MYECLNDILFSFLLVSELCQNDFKVCLVSGASLSEKNTVSKLHGGAVCCWEGSMVYPFSLKEERSKMYDFNFIFVRDCGDSKPRSFRLKKPQK